MTVTPGGATCSTYALNCSKILAGSWAVTSRQLTLAWAWAGMIVLVPSPWNPPHRPFTSSVGRAPRRSRTLKPASPTSAGVPISWR